MNRIHKYYFSLPAFFVFFACAAFVFLSCHSLFAAESVKFVQELNAGLLKPADVAVDSSGDIYVLDEEAAKVFIFDADGISKGNFGSPDPQSPQFSRPQSLAISPQGRIVVADTGNNRIQVFNKAGQMLFQFGAPGSLAGQFRSPCGVAVDQFGFIFVVDRDNRRVQTFSPNGIFLKVFEIESRGTDVGIDPQRNLYVLLPDTGKIIKYTPSGQILKEMAFAVKGRNDISRANGLTVDMRGDIYFTESLGYSVKKIDQEGAVIFSFGSQGEGKGQFGKTGGITFDAQGQIFIADTQNRRVQVLKITGSVKNPLSPEKKSPLVLDFDSNIQIHDSVSDLYFIPGRGLYALSDHRGDIFLQGRSNYFFGKTGKNPGEFQKPAAMEVTLDGRIFVADTGNHRVQILNPDGTLNYLFGKSGNRAGQFAGPQGIAVNSRGRIYVADTQNNRIQIFNNDGIFLASFGAKVPGEREDGEAGLRSPRALAIDSRDQVYVLDFENNAVKVFTENGEYKRLIGGRGSLLGQFEKAVDIALDENDNLYVADQGNYRIQIFNPQGMYILSFGSPGKGGGYFQEISAVAAAEGKIYVADYKSDAIQIFRYASLGTIKSDRIYATKTAYPPQDIEENDVVKFSLAKNEAMNLAVKELKESFDVSEEHLRKFVKIESVETLNDGQVKVTVSVLKVVPPEKKNISPRRK